MSELPGFGLTGLVEIELNLRDTPLQPGAYWMLASILKDKYNKSITNVDPSGSGIDTQVACFLVVALNHNVSITSLDLSNNQLCTLDDSTYNLNMEDFEGLYALAQVLALSHLSLLTNDS